MSISALWIEGRFPGLNEIISARSRGPRGVVYTRMKRSMTDLVSLSARSQRIPSMEKVWVTYVHIEKNRRRDPSNFCGAVAKFVEDGLVDAGVLENDGWGQIKGFQHTWFVGKNPGVMVVLSDDGPVPVEDARAIYKSRGNRA